MIPLQTTSKMNSIEEEFAWMLEQKKHAGEILDYDFEGVTFNLAPRTTYTPDFWIVYPDHFEVVDVKARGEKKIGISKKTGKPYKKQWDSKRDDAVVKMKVAAARFPHLKWVYYYHEANGAWTREEVQL